MFMSTEATEESSLIIPRIPASHNEASYSFRITRMMVYEVDPDLLCTQSELEGFNDLEQSRTELAEAK